VHWCCKRMVMGSNPIWGRNF